MTTVGLDKTIMSKDVIDLLHGYEEYIIEEDDEEIVVEWSLFCHYLSKTKGHDDRVTLE